MTNTHNKVVVRFNVRSLANVQVKIAAWIKQTEESIEYQESRDYPSEERLDLLQNRLDLLQQALDALLDITS